MDCAKPSCVNVDLFGTSRPQGLGSDIGMCERITLPGTPPKPFIKNLRCFRTTSIPGMPFLIAIEFFGVDDQADLCDIEVLWSAKTPFKSATAVPTHPDHSGVTALPFITYPGNKFTFVWDVAADNVPTNRKVKIKVRAFDGTRFGPFKKKRIRNLTLI